ncbi:MAG TPA: hypothetical protein VJR24_17285 [Gemmatimonadaceae bacterium]|nr:hypothetical protein [Gemmatimonadaceae bacterium]
MPFIRLPDPNVIHTTLETARLNPANAMAAKAKRELVKSIGWSYDSLSEAQKIAAEQAYLVAGGANLRAAVAQLKADRRVADAEIERMVRPISDAGGKGAHTGVAGRYRGMQANEPQAFGQALGRFRLYLAEINAGTHDALLDETFPNPTLYGFSFGGAPQWNTRRQVRNTFQYAYDAVSGWEADAVNRDQRIRIDTYLDPQGAAGTSNRSNLLLAESFFTKPLDQRVVTLVHEATHAIQDANYVTDDNGGYVGELRWFDAELDVRQRNASHFQYVIERIQGRLPAVRPAPVAGGGGAGGPESQAAGILRMAWICALNEYGNMYDYAHKAHPTAQEQERAIARGKLLGLPMGKTGAGGAPVVTDVDLASAEHRVARLGVLYGAGAPVRQAVEAAARENAHGAPVALTVDEILERVIAQGGGPIRKTSNHAKSVEMIKTLAYLCHQNRGLNGPTEAEQWARVHRFNSQRF